MRSSSTSGRYVTTKSPLNIIGQGYQENVKRDSRESQLLLDSDTVNIEVHTILNRFLELYNLTFFIFTKICSFNV